MDPLVRILTQYIDGTSNKWAEIARAQADSVFEWIAADAYIGPEILRQSSLGEEIHSLLLSPVAVSHYASLGSKEAIERALTLRVCAAVRSFESEVLIKETEVGEEPDDLDSEADPDEDPQVGFGKFIHEPVLEDSSFRPGTAFIFRPYEWVSEDWNARIDSSGIPEDRPNEQLVEDSCSSGLGLIDSKLYDAILKDPHLMRSIDWRQFERLLARILEEFGYSIELQRGTKDGGVDIFALKKDGVFGVEKYLVQAKRWKAAVGVAPVRELAFLHNHLGMTKSCLATTASFTRGAWQLADLHKWQLRLKDFDGLKEWVKEAQDIHRAGLMIRSPGGIYLPKK